MADSLTFKDRITARLALLRQQHQSAQTQAVQIEQQLVQLRANGNALVGAIQICESLLLEFEEPLVAEPADPQ